jgi:hypothetical protein
VGVVRAAGGNHIDFFPSALPAHARTHTLAHTPTRTHTHRSYGGSTGNF